METQKRGNPNWSKDESANPNGRPLGLKNKTTEAIKIAYTELLNNNLTNIQDWLSRTAETDPKGALDFLIKLSPFVIAKKTETEMVIESPLRIVIPSRDEE